MAIPAWHLCEPPCGYEPVSAYVVGTRMRSPQSIRNLLAVVGCILMAWGFLYRQNSAWFIDLTSHGACLVGLAVLIEMARFVVRLRDATRSAKNWQLNCEHCGFDLRGNNDGRCPECGTANSKVEKTQVELGPAVLKKLRDGQYQAIAADPLIGPLKRPPDRRSAIKLIRR